MNSWPFGPDSYTSFSETMLGWPTRYDMTLISLRSRRSMLGPSRVLTSAFTSTHLHAKRAFVATSVQLSTTPYAPLPRRDPGLYLENESCDSYEGKMW